VKACGVDFKSNSLQVSLISSQLMSKRVPDRTDKIAGSLNLKFKGVPLSATAV
jgi:hypothetical protein